MNLITFLKDVTDLLKKEKNRFALAGGLAASVYRSRPRLTNDLDFLLLAEGSAEEKAKEIIQKLGLKSTIIRRADLEGGPFHAIKRGRREPMIVAGRNKEDPSSIGLNMILPSMPWFESAMGRAEKNVIDFGGTEVPTITVEDMILSKFYAVQNSSTRFNDLDDLKSIFETRQELNLAYLVGQMQRLNIAVPKAIEEFVPQALRIAAKRR